MSVGGDGLTSASRRVRQRRGSGAIFTYVRCWCIGPPPRSSARSPPVARWGSISSWRKMRAY